MHTTAEARGVTMSRRKRIESIHTNEDPAPDRLAAEQCTVA